MIPRRAAADLRDRLDSSAAVVLIGPRQVGKTTLARDLADDWESGAAYLDLERPSDRRRLDDPVAFLSRQAPKLSVLDEVQRMPELMEALRGVIDDNRRAGFRSGQFLLLGSAALDVVRSSESLAGRVSYLELTGVNVDEAADAGIDADTLWLRGGFPESLTARDDAASLRWRQDIIRAYLERDVPMFAPMIPAETLRRLWTMLAHMSGGLLNASRLGDGLGISGQTASRYIDLLADLMLVRRLNPWFVNVGKRVTKAPKVHVRDPGLLHALLGLETLDDVLGHPAAGHSYESFVVECLIDAAGDRFEPYHYRTARGDELDLVLVRGGRVEFAIEVKRSTAPSIGAGFHRAAHDVEASERWIVHPGVDGGAYPAGEATVIGIHEAVQRLRGA